MLYGSPDAVRAQVRAVLDSYRDGNGGSRIACHRFENEGARRQVCALKALLDQEAVIAVAQYRRAGKARFRLQTHQRLAEQILAVPVEADELLGIHGPRQRPQACAGATGQDHRKQSAHRHSLGPPTVLCRPQRGSVRPNAASVLVIVQFYRCSRVLTREPADQRPRCISRSRSERNASAACWLVSLTGAGGGGTPRTEGCARGAAADGS